LGKSIPESHDCDWPEATLAPRVEGIEQDARKRANICTSKGGIAWFFVEHNTLLNIAAFQRAMLLNFSRLG
jgi:hypothetical protein